MNKRSYRVSSIDLLRGIVMMLMALDHVRDYFHNDALVHDPLDLATTTPLLFFTRWVTHYCAPVFIFLSGISAYLSGLKKTKKELSLFLVKRGAWLIAIEFSVIAFGWTFDPFYHVFIFQVIWAIGISMIVLGLLVRLPYQLIVVLGLAIVFGHNLLDAPEAAREGNVGFWWNLLHHGGFSTYPFSADHAVLIIYPFVPWTGLMITGYCTGKLFVPGVDPIRRKKVLLSAGFALILFFVILRWSNSYGDSSMWTTQKSGLYTLLSFVNTCKYPPSLLYLCMTIGPAMILMAFTENVSNKFSDWASVFGRVPFFYYILHIYLVHILVVITFFLLGYSTADIISYNSPFLFRPPHLGFDLWVVYVIWVMVLLILYPFCRWYDRYKKAHRSWWLSYL